MATDQGAHLARPTPSSLADVVEIVLSKGIVIDAYAQVSVAGIELLTIDARIVVSSVDTYLRFAEATHRVDLWDQGGRALPDIMAEDTEAMVTKVASSVVERKVDGALSKVGDTLGEPAEKVARSATTKAAGALGRVVTKASDPREDPGQD